MQIKNLNLSIAGKKLVSDLNWQIAPGECWVIIGKNGAGKSTLLRTLAGMRSADSGQIQLQGRALGLWPLLELARQRAYLAQNRNDAFAYTALDTVLSARHPYQESQYWDNQAEQDLAMAAMDQLDVAHLAKRDVRSLSGGERQRVAIAALLTQDTPWLLADEPANALDLAHQMSVMRIFSKLCQTGKKAVLMVSHDLNLACQVATHALLLMDDGRWLAGCRDEVFKPELLGACLGYPVSALQHQGQLVFLPLPHHE